MEIERRDGHIRHMAMTEPALRTFALSWIDWVQARGFMWMTAGYRHASGKRVLKQRIGSLKPIIVHLFLMVT
jgi:hypothetical protein